MMAKLVVNVRDNMVDEKINSYEFIGFDQSYSKREYIFVSYNETNFSLREIRRIGNWEYKCDYVIIGDRGNSVFWKPVKPINAHVVFNELVSSIKNKENYDGYE